MVFVTADVREAGKRSKRGKRVKKGKREQTGKLSKCREASEVERKADTGQDHVHGLEQTLSGEAHLPVRVLLESLVCQRSETTNNKRIQAKVDTFYTDII